MTSLGEVEIQEMAKILKMEFNDTKFAQLPMGRDGWRGFERSMRLRSQRSHLAGRGRHKGRAMDWGKKDCVCTGKWCNLQK